MNPKLLILLAWIFYLLERRTADELWFFCMVCSCILAACAHFYKKDRRNSPEGRKKAKDA